jgi:uncharacterized protein (DUF983 family)
MQETRLNWWRAMRNGWSNRCPDCGRGKIWEGNDIRGRCSECGFIYEPDQADWGGSMWAFAVEGVLIAVGVGVVELVGHLSFITHVYLWCAFTVAWHLLFYRRMKGQWIGLRAALIGGRPDNRA